MRKSREPRMQSPAEIHQKRRVLNGPSPWTLKSPRTEAAEELRGEQASSRHHERVRRRTGVFVDDANEREGER